MATFKARARTVDMLGRQQIAGAATAISELFKNAHDAYATRVEADYYRPQGLFLLRDNGVGMTLDEFSERWLTIGTDNKVVRSGDRPFRPAGMEIRPVMGEKGIGRLAIARIGPQVLVMTRASRNGTLHDLVVALVNWEMFELPNVNLDEIEIPLEVCAAGLLPDREMIERLTLKLRQAIKALGKKVPSECKTSIHRSLDALIADPRKLEAFFNSYDVIDVGDEPLSLAGSRGGTHFLIQPADQFLGQEIERDQRADTEPTFSKFLVGFANTMVPGAKEPQLKTRFRDWRFPEIPTELIAGGSFISPEDFEKADHHFSGSFDAYGQFEGDVRIYDSPPMRHTIAWEGAAGEPTMCGAFTINLAYLQGAARESHLTPAEHALLYQKLNRFGGLYVYKEGIRVLPYGNSDFDWLNIETRRNKGSGYYFFAYRRMFGAVEITKDQNPALMEKAGREGFQLNRAYRQFTEILENFFIQLAADFFRDKGLRASVFALRRSDLERAELARRRREEGVAARRKAFAKELETFFKAVEDGEPLRQVSLLFDEVQTALQAAKNDPSKDRAGALLLETESYVTYRLDEIERTYSLTRPRDIGLGGSVKRDWEAYLGERERLDAEVFSPAADRLRKTVGAIAAAARLHVNQRKRLQKLIGDLAEEVQKEVASKASELRKLSDSKRSDAQELAQAAVLETRQVLESVRIELQRTDLENASSDVVEACRRRLEAKMNTSLQSQRSILSSAAQQLREVTLQGGGGPGVTISPGEITGALEEELLAMREAAEADAELVQLGMALAVVTHEFDAAIRTIREQLRRLKGWADASPQLRPLYQKIAASFEHLDGYLALFTPLQRRLYRNPQKISGAEIAKFADELFGARLKRHKVEFHATDAFCIYSVSGYPSTFYPVFINIIDNAIFWLKDYRGLRRITLDADELGIEITNSGPKIAVRDVEAIFDLRFSRKPGGRGMGLYISRQTLAKAGYRLFLDVNSDHPVCFRISPENGPHLRIPNGQE